MHIIDGCLRCGKAYMRHTTDVFLKRNVTNIDEVGNNEIIDIYICHDCHEEEIFLESKNQHNG